MSQERAREDGIRLRRYSTRTDFITTPYIPLEKTLKMTIVDARLYYYKEQKRMKRPLVW